jgi:hypothetical protein
MRFLKIFTNNSGAVQAASAIVQACFAIAIWKVTGRYANLTADLVMASENQLQREAFTGRTCDAVASHP